MTKMVVDTLVTELEQEFTYNLSDRLLVGGIRPYLFFWDNPPGTFTFELIYGAQTIASASFTSAEVSTALGTSDLYYRVAFNLDFDKQFFLVNGDYSLKLTSTGYSFSEDSFIAWHRMHEDLVNEIRYTPTDDARKPLSFELWEYRP